VGQLVFTLEGGASPAPAKPVHAPVEHGSEQHDARISLHAAIQAEGKTEEQVLRPEPAQAAVPSFSLPANLGKTAGTEHRDPVPAAPSTRRLARELGVDIHDVKGTGPSGRISEDDVKAHAKSLVIAAAAGAAEPRHLAEPELPDFSKWGKIERVSM